MNTCTKETLSEVIARYGGLKHGSHGPNDGACCILEAVSVCEGREWTDSPSKLDRPDVRPLNDAAWPDAATRTEQMLRLAPLLEAWPRWSVEKRVAWARAVALRTVREVLPHALRAAKVDESLVVACETASDLTAYAAANAAARAAHNAYAAYAAAAANAAARAAHNAYAAADAAYAAAAAANAAARAAHNAYAAYAAAHNAYAAANAAARAAHNAYAAYAAAHNAYAAYAAAAANAAADAADAAARAADALPILTLAVTIWAEEAARVEGSAA